MLPCRTGDKTYLVLGIRKFGLPGKNKGLALGESIIPSSVFVPDSSRFVDSNSGNHVQMGWDGKKSYFAPNWSRKETDDSL